MTPFQQAMWENRSEFEGDIYLPESPGYQQICKLYNGRIKRRPSVIVRPATTECVCLAIKYAGKHDIQVTAKGGGHSACGTCLIDDGLVLDMSGMKQINLSPKEKRVTVSAGVLNKELDRATLAYSQALPLGTCGDVGVIGSTIGGGIGFLSRAYGLACDNIISASMVNADGKLIAVNEEETPDLLWSLKGGGGSQLGIVTDITYQTFDMPKRVYGGTIDWPLKHGVEVLKRYSDFMLEAPNHHFLYAYISFSDKADAKISVMGFAMDTPEVCQTMFSDIARWCPDAQTNLGFRNYLDVQSNHYANGLAIYWKHGVINSGLSENFCRTLIECFEACPNMGGGIMLDPLGGAISNISPSETAFCHRESTFICSITGLALGEVIPPETQTWVTESQGRLAPFYNGLAYANYEDTEINEVSSYFGQNRDKMKGLKQIYDVTGRFGGSVNRNLKLYDKVKVSPYHKS
jgi:hypothetical protein